MGILQDDFKRLQDALARDEGIKPEGSAQAALIAFAGRLATVVELLDAKVSGIEERSDSPGSMVRVEAKLDQLLTRGGT